MIVRFELPFDIWCGGCNQHVGQGVRYNAEKRKVGNYYSTPIWAFRCKCHLCSHWFEIQTDPKNTRYIVSEGAKQKAEWQPDESETIAVMETDPFKEPPKDPFAEVEKGTSQKEHQNKVVVPRLTQLEDANETTWSDTYSMNQKLRNKHRVERHKEHAVQRSNNDLKDKYAIRSDLNITNDDSNDLNESLEFKKVQKSNEQLGTLKRRRDDAYIGRKSNRSNGDDLKSSLLSNTRKKADPFLNSNVKFKFRK